uniref:Uncharacterized protein n=1 Tax=Panagrolaimus sp. PS1159 TaxID=55785 RepID=A0AC35FV73_9BILA
MFQSPSTGSTTSSSDLKDQVLDSIEISEKQAAECNKCKHYKALEDAIESIEGPLFPFYNELKWIFYGSLWIGIGFLFFTLTFRNQFCEALDRLEKELL